MKYASVFCALLFFPFVYSPAEENPKGNPYVTGGVPATDRVWDGDAYQKAAEAVISENVPLPKLSDPHGKRVIDRFTNRENLKSIGNGELSMNLRLQDFIGQLSGVAGVLNLYAEKISNPGDPDDVHAETASLMAFSLHVAAEGIDLVEEFLPTIPKDEYYEKKMAGLEQMKSGLTQMFSGAMESLSEDVYSKEDIHLMLEAMNETLPGFAPMFTAEFRQEVKYQLGERKKDLSGADLKLVQGMLDTIEAQP